LRPSVPAPVPSPHPSPHTSSAHSRELLPYPPPNPSRSTPQPCVTRPNDRPPSFSLPRRRLPSLPRRLSHGGGSLGITAGPLPSLAYYRWIPPTFSVLYSFISRVSDATQNHYRVSLRFVREDLRGQPITAPTLKIHFQIRVFEITSFEATAFFVQRAHSPAAPPGLDQ